MIFEHALGEATDGGFVLYEQDRLVAPVVCTAGGRLDLRNRRSSLQRREIGPEHTASARSTLDVYAASGLPHDAIHAR